MGWGWGGWGVLGGWGVGWWGGGGGGGGGANVGVLPGRRLTTALVGSLTSNYAANDYSMMVKLLS